jgi:hypothetical protein
MRRTGLLLACSILMVACAPAGPSPSSDIPAVDAAPAGWILVGSIGTTSGPGFAGIDAAVRPGPVSLAVACRGEGTLLVTIGGDPPAAGADALAFPCSAAAPTVRHALDPVAAVGRLQVAGAVVDGLGVLRPSRFQLAFEQPAP